MAQNILGQYIDTNNSISRLGAAIAQSTAITNDRIALTNRVRGIQEAQFQEPIKEKKDIKSIIAYYYKR